MQLKSAAKFPIVIGLITKHSERRIPFSSFLFVLVSIATVTSELFIYETHCVDIKLEGKF